MIYKTEIDAIYFHIHRIDSSVSDGTLEFMRKLCTDMIDAECDTLHDYRKKVVDECKDTMLRHCEPAVMHSTMIHAVPKLAVAMLPVMMKTGAVPDPDQFDEAELRESLYTYKPCEAMCMRMEELKFMFSEGGQWEKQFYWQRAALDCLDKSGLIAVYELIKTYEEQGYHSGEQSILSITDYSQHDANKLKA